MLDPDSQVRETITYFFETFLRVGSASQTVKVFKKEGLLFPSVCATRSPGLPAPHRVDGTSDAKQSALRRCLRLRPEALSQTRRRAESAKKRGRKDWLACIPDAHPGYITWERYEQNLAVLETNGRGYKVARSSPPREGAALLQGRAVCGRCGRYLRLRYATRRGRQEAWYVCDRAQGARGEPTCQSMPERRLMKQLAH
ncbi:hypothetical protein BZM27_52230 [Paraburkholderia steynii]|uniref:Recombinase zinc beta ribbon domain-containing protein n=1 Tax=Paraburkholderia steynii TaxID=1245441 RepID=A0A4R0X8E3_9BURK|nr:hypothetical protein BZM27_52230 [Paraburkholderia steynii]